MLKNLLRMVFPLLALSGLFMAAWSLVMSPDGINAALPYANGDARFSALTEVAVAPAAVAMVAKSR